MIGAFVPVLIAGLLLMIAVLLLDGLLTILQEPATTAAFETAAEQTTTADPVSAIPVAVGVAVIAADVLLNAYRARADLDRYAITSVGTYPRVEHHVAEEPGVACRDCRRDLRPGDRAERRRYWRETVLAGAVIHRSEPREAYYCADHAAHEVRDELEPIGEPSAPTGPAPATSATDRDAVENRVATDGGQLTSDAINAAGSMTSLLFMTIVVVPVVVAIATIARVFGVDLPVADD